MLGHTVHFSLPILNHPANIPLTFTLQPLVPLIGGIGDDPVVRLLQYPAEVRSVVVSIGRNTACVSIQQYGSFVLLEEIDGTVHMKVRGK